MLNNPLFQLKHISKVYEEGGIQTTALEKFSFTIHNGEFVAIMGPSGSGKSTLLHILGFLDKPTSGTFLFEGKSVDNFTDEQLAQTRNSAMGFVFQSFHLLPRTTVFDNIRLPLLYSSLPESEWHERVETALEDVQLTNRKWHESNQLSGGEKQRVAIARALVLAPKVIFADEPTGNLDSKTGHHILSLFQKLHQDRKHTIILITHDPDIAQVANRRIILKDGNLTESL